MERNRPQGRDKKVSGDSKGVKRRGSGLNTGPVGSGSMFGSGGNTHPNSGSGRPQGNASPRPQNNPSPRPQSPRPQSQRPQQYGGSPRPSGGVPFGTGGQGGYGSGGNGGFSSGGNGGYGSGGNGNTRSRKKSRAPLLILLAILLLGGGGGGILSGLFGGSDNSENDSLHYQQVTETAAPAASSQNGGNVFTQGTPNNSNGNGSTTSHAAPGTVRAPHTEILGNGQDTVTIMVYMCGTDLESRGSMATKDLVEMAGAKLGDNLHVIVFTGGCARWNNQIISSTVNQIYEVDDGGLITLVENAGTGVMTDPATLTSFIQWCGKNYPANRNELILWDHGGGSVSGYGYDEKHKASGSMTLDNIAKALRDSGMKFDFIGFDACLMATLETGLMLDEFADYMIASEETEPGIGWYYTNWLTSFSNNTSMDTVSIGKSIVDDFVVTCANKTPNQTATLSVIDLAELSASAPESLKNFSQSLSTLITNNQYRQISEARNGTREFARSSVIDQIDLVDFAQRVGTPEGEELALDLRGAVKYNRTSSGMTNAYGVSIYFPYRKASNVDKAVSTYSAIGMDDSYSQAIREFASLEVSGQASAGGSASALSSLLESLYGTSLSGGGGSAPQSAGVDLIGSLLGSFLGGDFSSISGLSSSNTDFLFGRSMSTDDTISYISNNFFDPSALVWTENNAGETVISLTEDQWDLIVGVDLNMFYDDGTGYVDLGLDNTYEFDEDGNLLAPYDRTWLAVNGQPVAYYHDVTYGEGEDALFTGHIPAYLNGVRVELLVVFGGDAPYGRIVGARPVYVDGETDTVAKSMTEIVSGDKLEFICDYYTYDGEYENTYYLGDPMTVSGNLELTNVDLGDGSLYAAFRFTDIYQQHYWTPSLVG